MDTHNQSKIENKCRKEIDTLCWLIEDAFDGDLAQSLMSNLANLREEDWNALPASGGRSISDILEHVGWCKWMYEDYAFGSASLRGDLPPLVPDQGTQARPYTELISWLKEGHYKWLGSVRALADDSELEKDRLTNWGEKMKI
jgi:hypothetical protein